MTDERADKGISDAFRNLESTGESGRDWTPEEVFEAVYGDLSRQRVTELVDRSVDDVELAEAFRVARAVRVAAEDVDSKAERAPSTRGRSTRTRNFFALTAAAAALIAFVWLIPREGIVELNTSEIRSAEGYEIAAESKRELSRYDFRLSWTTGPPNTRYFFEAIDSELEILFTRKRLETSSITIPPEALAEVTTGEQVIWRVEAYLEDGRTVRSSAFRTIVAD